MNQTPNTRFCVWIDLLFHMFPFRAHLNWHVIHDEHSNGERNNQMKLGIHLLATHCKKSNNNTVATMLCANDNFSISCSKKIFRKENSCQWYVYTIVLISATVIRVSSSSSIFPCFFFLLLSFIEHKTHRMCNGQLSKQKTPILIS